jgi:hypothetical protein
MWRFLPDVRWVSFKRGLGTAKVHNNCCHFEQGKYPRQSIRSKTVKDDYAIRPGSYYSPIYFYTLKEAFAGSSPHLRRDLSLEEHNT